MTSLLIFTPTWTVHGQDAIVDECRASIEAQRIDGAITWVIGRENPYRAPDHRNVLPQYRAARDLFLAGAYDALLTVEHDNVLPDAGAAQRLLDTRLAPGGMSADVVYAPYLLRPRPPVLSTWRYVNDRALGKSLSYYPQALARARAAGVARVCGAGFGCTLFRRRVLEAIEFGPSSGRNPCPDLGFAEAALRAGFVSAARFDVPVGHLVRGRRLSPFAGEWTMVYQAVRDVDVTAAGRSLHLAAGRAYELTEDEVADLTRQGYIGPAEREAASEEARERVKGRRANRAKTLAQD